MVVRSGFEVQLVSADTKIPFKEHEKDGKIYVEAEPDAEYFIAIRRISMDGPLVILTRYAIDGQDLKYGYAHARAEKQPHFRGVLSRIDMVSCNTALKLSKPRPATNGDGYVGGMGKAEVTLYEAILQGSKSYANVSKGSTTIKSGSQRHVQVDSKHEFYVKGDLVDTITLNYCSALGMIEAGVFPKPGLRDHARMKHPAPSGQLTVATNTIKDPVDPSKFIDLIDLSDEK